jgi:hypothetical protein
LALAFTRIGSGAESPITGWGAAVNATPDTLGITHLAQVPDTLVDRAALRAIAGGDIDDHAWALLNRTKRGTERVGTMLHRRLGVADPAALTEIDHSILAAGPRAWHEIAKIAGAIAEAGAIRLIVSGPDVVTLIASCGVRAREVALALEDDTFEHAVLVPGRADTDTIIARVHYAGQAALAAWLADLPAGFAARAALLLWPEICEPAQDAPAALLFRRAATLRAA